MRLAKVAAVVGLLLTAAPAFAQEWIEYKNLDDRFGVNAPGQPTVEKTTWKSEYDSVFPMTVYRWQVGPNTYSMSVVDYSNSEALYVANGHSVDFQAAAYWQIDILGSIQYAATKYRMRPGVKVNFDAFHYINLVTGHQLQLVNPDQTKTYVAIYLHENRLYILDATVAKNAPAPIIFQQSIGWLDAQGRRIRYLGVYHNEPNDPKPPFRFR